MSNYTDYHALEGTTEIGDITSDEANALILRRIKENNPNITSLSVCHQRFRDAMITDYKYVPDGGSDIGWLGYFIGNSTNLVKLELYFTQLEYINGGVESFWRGMCSNRSIERLRVVDTKIPVQLLGPFFENNTNLMDIQVSNCDFGTEDECRLLSLAIGGGKSLRNFSISRPAAPAANFVDIIVALSMHPKLEGISLCSENLDRNECISLGTLVQTTAELRNLETNIDNEGLLTLVNGLTMGSPKLQKLSLGGNGPFTDTGWKALGMLLERTNSIQEIRLRNFNFDDEAADIFARALVHNSTLKTLGFEQTGGGLSAIGWRSFAMLLCNGESVNKTFFSNHTLEKIEIGRSDISAITEECTVLSLLRSNRSEDKKIVAAKKILESHPHIDMNPLFEWDLKTLPLIMARFDQASTHPDLQPRSGKGGIGLFASRICGLIEPSPVFNRSKLSTIYQFIRAMPELSMEERTKGEINVICTNQTKLQQERLYIDLQLRDLEQQKLALLNRLKDKK